MIQQLITPTQALRIMMALLSAVVVFHLCIITGIIPYQNVWAGRLKSSSEMYLFESISMLLNVLLIAVLCIKAGYLKMTISATIINGIIWLFVVVFFLNTIGNMFAENNIERVAGGLLTAVSTLLCWRIVR
jgi:hypothetical protein